MLGCADKAGSVRFPSGSARRHVASVVKEPNMGYTPADLLKQEAIVDLGEDSVKYTDLATEVTSS